MSTFYTNVPDGPNSAPGDDVIDRGLGELTAGNLGKMPMCHQRLVEFQWPGFEYEIHRGTQPSHPLQSQFGQLTGLEGRQGRAADCCLSGKLA